MSPGGEERSPIRWEPGFRPTPVFLEADSQGDPARPYPDRQRKPDLPAFLTSFRCRAPVPGGLDAPLIRVAQAKSTYEIRVSLRRRARPEKLGRLVEASRGRGRVRLPVCRATHPAGPTWRPEPVRGGGLPGDRCWDRTAGPARIAWFPVRGGVHEVRWRVHPARETEPQGKTLSARTPAVGGRCNGGPPDALVAHRRGREGSGPAATSRASPSCPGQNLACPRSIPVHDRAAKRPQQRSFLQPIDFACEMALYCAAE